jgi:hypothetical protein
LYLDRCVFSSLFQTDEIKSPQEIRLC